MTEGLTIRAVERAEATPQFVAAAASLLDRAYDHWPAFDLGVSREEHLAWKMAGPTPGFPAALAAEIGGRLVGYRTLLARQLLVQGKTRLFLHFVDAAVDPGMQGRGINGAMQQLMMDQFHPLFDLSVDDSGNATILRGRILLGAVSRFGNAIRPYLRPLDGARLFSDRRRTRRIPSALGGGLLNLASGGVRLASSLDRRSSHDYSLRTIEEFDSRFDEFCRMATMPYDFVAVRDSEFLNWRYADRRAGNFVIRVAERDGEILGYAVTKPSGLMTKLADVLVAPTEIPVAAALVEDSVRLAREAESAGVTCWLPQQHTYRGALRRSGFVAFRRTTRLMYRAVSMHKEELSFLRSGKTPMHYTMGDTDLV